MIAPSATLARRRNRSSEAFANLRIAPCSHKRLFRLTKIPKLSSLAAAFCLRHDRDNGNSGRSAMRHVDREALMRRVLSGFLGGVLAVAATSAFAQSKPPLKLGGILDMSGLYADITGAGSETAAKMAAGDFGGGGEGR